MIEPPCTEPYARWCERSANQLMISRLLDLLFVWPLFHSPVLAMKAAFMTCGLFCCDLVVPVVVPIIIIPVIIVIVIEIFDILVTNLAGLGIDLVLVFLGAGIEFDLVNADAILAVQLCLGEGHRGSREPCILERDGFCFIDPDVVGGRCCLAAAGGSVVLLRDREVLNVLIERENFAGLGIDFIVIFGAAAVEFDLVDLHAVFIVELCFNEGCLRGGNAGVRKRELLRPSLRDLACGSAVVRGSILRILICCLCFGYSGLFGCVSVCPDDRTIGGLYRLRSLYTQ